MIKLFSLLKMRLGLRRLTSETVDANQSLLNELTCWVLFPCQSRLTPARKKNEPWLVISLTGWLEKPTGNNEYKHPHEWLVQYFKF